MSKKKGQESTSEQKQQGKPISDGNGGGDTHKRGSKTGKEQQR